MWYVGYCARSCGQRVDAAFCTCLQINGPHDVDVVAVSKKDMRSTV